jgi:hypothetical protein
MCLNRKNKNKEKEEGQANGKTTAYNVKTRQKSKAMSEVNFW